MHYPLLLLLLPGIFVEAALSSSLRGLQSTHEARMIPGLNDTISVACQQTCNELSMSFGTALHYPEEDNLTFWDARQQAVRPACRVEPTSTANVSSILTTLVKNGCRFAVKCGGHSRNEDDSNSVGGVTIDLQKMSTVTLTENKTSAYIGGGATSHQVLTALEPFNLAFVAGRTGSVGIGGFTLGGGTSTLSPRWGWALDNVFEYEVVLANASVVTASEHENPDLYWALRGGANNFGIVTSFLARVFPQGPVWGQTWNFNANRTTEILAESQRLFTSVDDPDNLYEYFDSYSQAQDRFTTVARARYAQPIQNPQVYDGLNRLPYDTTTGAINSLANLSAPTPFSGNDRHLFNTLTYYPSLEVSQRAINIFRQEVQTVKNVRGLVPFLIVYPIPTNAVKAMKERGGNALGIDEDSPLIITMLSLIWSDQADDARMNAFSDKVIQEIRSVAVSENADHPYIYINYAKYDQDPFTSYGEQNRKRLTEIQSSVDPDGIFTSHGLWRGFFKLQ